MEHRTKFSCWLSLIQCQEFPQFSGSCQDWIDWLIHKRNIKIQSAFHGGEKKIGPYKADDFCSEHNTIFEFYGAYWHCHQDQFPDENVIHPTIKEKDDNPIRVKDIHARDQDLQNQGYTVAIIWEKGWQALLTQRPELKSYLSQHGTYIHFKEYLTQDQIIQYTQDRHLFGFVKCNIEVPDHLKDYFSEMTLIFKNTDLTLKDIGEFMQQYAKEHSVKDAPHCLLIESYFGKKIGLSTPSLIWYLEDGIVITHIYILHCHRIYT